MKRLFALLALCLPIYLFAQGFGSFSHDQPYFAKDISSGVVLPTSDHYGWYDASQKVTNFFGITPPPTNNSKLGTWGPYLGNVSYIEASRGGGITEPSYFLTGSNTNGPRIKNTSIFAVFGQMSQNATVWSGAAGGLTQPVTIFMVFRIVTPNPNGQEGIMRGESGVTFYIKSSNVNSNLTMFAGTSLAGANGAIKQNTWYLLTAQFNGTNSFMRTNGVEYVTGNAGTNKIIGLSIGHYDSNWYLLGDYCDVVFYDRALDTNEIQTVELVLKTKNNL